jgi:hypothetical protein
MSNRPAYKPKFTKQKYKPKMKPKELINVARKICSTPDDYKSKIEPVEFEWYPEKDVVLLHFTYDSEAIDPQETYTLAFPVRPFEIGYDKWIEELKERYKK